MNRELLAHVVVTSVLKRQLGLGAEIHQLLEAARGLDVIEQQLQEKYDQRFAEIIAAIDEVDLQKQLLNPP